MKKWEMSDEPEWRDPNYATEMKITVVWLDLQIFLKKTFWVQWKKRQKKRWETIIKEWMGMDFCQFINTVKHP